MGTFVTDNLPGPAITVRYCAGDVSVAIDFRGRLLDGQKKLP